MPPMLSRGYGRPSPLRSSSLGTRGGKHVGERAQKARSLCARQDESVGQVARVLSDEEAHSRQEPRRAPPAGL